MPTYKLDIRAAGEGFLKKHADRIKQLTLEDGEATLVTTGVLSKEKGVRLVPESAVATAVAASEAKPRASYLPAARSSNLEVRQTWTVEPYSTRQATLTTESIRAGAPCLQVTLGGGRGDQICIGTSAALPATKSFLTLRARGLFAEGERMSLGIVLTTARERPWLEVVTVDLKQGEWQTIEAALNGLDADKLKKVNRLNLVIGTDADEGFCQIQDMHILVETG